MGEATQEQTIPVVDLRHFKEGSQNERAGFIQTLGDALHDIGFFSLSNHGIGQQLIKDSYAAAHELFQLPAEVKKKYELPQLMGDRGFTSFGKEQALGHHVPDLKEFWHVGVECDPLPPGQNSNIWPKEVPAFKANMSTLFNEMMEVSLDLLRACALYLDEPEELFAEMAKGGNTSVRVIHYPPVPEDAQPAQVRAAAHEDINLITLLCESTASGLELLERDGSWRPIHTLEGEIVVDSGDMIQHLTNGFFKATTHRVVNPDNSRERRYSMPCFVHPRSDVELAALPSCVKRTGGVKHYEDINCGEALRKRLMEIGLSKK